MIFVVECRDTETGRMDIRSFLGEKRFKILRLYGADRTSKCPPVK